VGTSSERDKLGDAIKYWIRPDIENRIKEGAIAAHFGAQVLEIHSEHLDVITRDGRMVLPSDDVLLLTGYHPDVDLMRRAGVRVDEKTLKPACHATTLESNVPGLYLAGAIISGRETNRIFIENGRFHGEAITREIRERLSREHVGT
jgi:thioredoxin reductase (NADPH)